MTPIEKADPASFVTEVIERAKSDNAFAARLRRADNPATEDQSYWFLAGKGIDLTDDRERLPYALVGAAICKAQPEGNGKAGLGQALAASFAARESGDNAERGSEKPGSNRLRRLLACSRLPEICQVLRPVLPFIAANSAKPLDYARLLRDLLNFEKPYGQTIRRRWAQEFYGTEQPEEPAAKEPA